MALMENLPELRQAAEFRFVRNQLRSCGPWVIVFGFLALTAGLPGMKLALVLLGAYLIIEGIWVLLSPSPVGFMLTGLGLAGVGVFNIMLSLSDIEKRGSTFWIVFGIVQIYWAAQQFKQYKRFSHLKLNKFDSIAVSRIDAIVNSLKTAQPDMSTDIIQFNNPKGRWKVRLLDDGAIILGPVTDMVLFTEKGEFEITEQGPAPNGKALKAVCRVRNGQIPITIEQRFYDIYESWKRAY